MKILSFHICTINGNHMMYGSWDMVHDRQIFGILDRFFPFTQKIKIFKKIENTWRYYHFTNINESYDVWFLRYGVQMTEFLSFWTIFCPFTPPSLKSKFWKNEKTPGDIIILHKCTINDNHMMYGSWDKKRDGQNFLSFWTVFVLLP